MRGYFHGLVGPIDMDSLEITLVSALDRREKGSVQIPSFLGTFQKRHDNFEDKDVKIIKLI